jgi:glycosyltransferase involved in cell wall biosynthesis
MSQRRKKRAFRPKRPRDKLRVANQQRLERKYLEACALAQRGQEESARGIYETLTNSTSDKRLTALIANDLASLAAMNGDSTGARAGFENALASDAECQAARDNLALLDEDQNLSLASAGVSTRGVAAAIPPAPCNEPKVAVLSFLFNWPSTGGGIVHTVELAKFLGQAEYGVRHFYARFSPWRIGGVEGALPIASEVLEFDSAHWNIESIQTAYRRAVDAFSPDFVIIMDSWNFKPYLAEAMRGYPTFMRFQALECLCPLNNVRLLLGDHGKISQCPKHQLATPHDCYACLRDRGGQSGGLHQAERELARVGTQEYYQTLLQALRDAEGVLVLNPFTEMMLSPYAQRVHVVPWGMDPARFPWPWPEPAASVRDTSIKTILQAGVISEAMKGFHVLHEACARIRQKRKDFELVATGDPAGQVDKLTRFTGWVSQEDLPHHYRAADIVVVPTVAQEGLSRTSVEAMAAGRPVVASRIGGLPFTVADGATGLLCTPDDPEDLAQKLETLLDDADLRRRMGAAGRKRFEDEFSWPVVIERHYRPLLSKARKTRG